MTPAQLTALAATITADTTLAAYAALNEFPQIATAMNVATATLVWMPNVPTSAILSAILVADMAALTAPQLAYLQMLLTVGTVDATNANVRANFSALFAGKTSLSNLISVSARAATRFEALAGFITVATPNNVSAVYGLGVSAADVQLALGK